MPHAVSRLRAACLSDSATRPYLDRGDLRKERCARCRLIPSHCMCALRPVVSTRAAVCLIMGEFEALKPSNTGWLVADVVPDTTAFGWSRTGVDPALLALLADPQWQPYLVFPGEFALAERVVSELLVDRLPAGADEARPSTRPLFILLDGTWSEARKIFRKSPYLDPFPVLSLRPDQLSRYRLRRSTHAHHFCTSEVAALCLALAGDLHAAQTLETYLDVFSSRYLRARQSVPADGEDAAHRRLRELARGEAGAELGGGRALTGPPDAALGASAVAASRPRAHGSGSIRYHSTAVAFAVALPCRAPCPGAKRGRRRAATLPAARDAWPTQETME